jgi:hypothetical protein
MKYRTFIFLMGLLVTACTYASPVAQATSTSILLPSPTVLSLTPTATSSPAPTFTPTLPPLPVGTEILFEEAGSRNLSGSLYGEGETAILLANMSMGGDVQWSPFLAAVDQKHFTMVTFNYRSTNNADQDIRLVLEKLREQGYKRIICIGASLGVTACSSIAREPEIVGIILIAGRMIRGSLAEAAYPKLFIAGALDPIAPNTQMAYDQSAEPKELVLFEENRAHGTDLFSSKDGEAFLFLLLDFVNGLPSP